MQVNTLPKIDRTQFSERLLATFKGKHFFALVLEVGSPDLSRLAGIRDGKLHWIIKSAAQAHREFKYYVPGDWYNAPLGERVLSVTLIREDGKIWTK